MLKRKKVPRLLRTILPQYIATSVDAIDFAGLKKSGITTLLVDLDGTVVERGMYEVSASIIARLRTQPLEIIIATNRPSNQELKNLKADLSATGVVHPTGLWAKPSKRYYTNALAVHHKTRSEVAMVGDRYLQDVIGANRAGLVSVLVHQLGPSTAWNDRILYRLQKWFTQRIKRFYKPY